MYQVLLGKVNNITEQNTSFSWAYMLPEWKKKKINNKLKSKSYGKIKCTKCK